MGLKGAQRGCAMAVSSTTIASTVESESSHILAGRRQQRLALLALRIVGRGGRVARRLWVEREVEPVARRASAKRDECAEGVVSEDARPILPPADVVRLVAGINRHSAAE